MIQQNPSDLRQLDPLGTATAGAVSGRVEKRYVALDAKEIAPFRLGATWREFLHLTKVEKRALKDIDDVFLEIRRRRQIAAEVFDKCGQPVP